MPSNAQEQPMSTLIGKYLVLVSDCEQMTVQGKPFDSEEAAIDFAELQAGIDWLVVKVEAERE